MGPLAGTKVVELVGVGPGPFCGMLLADLGAEVVRVARPAEPGGLDPRADVLARGRRSVAVDLKRPEGVEAVLRLIALADGLIDPFRPGVAERLGLGPEPCLERNPRLVYGRMTGWGQEGPSAHRAGHDVNFLAVNGVLGLIGREDSPPVPPLNLVGDFGGGAMFLAVGLLAGMLYARATGRGQVVDAAMVDGAAALTAMVHQLRAVGSWSDERGTNVLDTGAPYYDVYETADGRYMSVGAMEAQFYDQLIEALGLSSDELVRTGRHDKGNWKAIRARVAEAFRSRSRVEWEGVFRDRDACAEPVLTLEEAMSHDQIRTRSTYVERFGVTQPAPAPRFSLTPSELTIAPALPGEHSRQVLLDWGFSAQEVDELIGIKAIHESP